MTKDELTQELLLAASDGLVFLRQLIRGEISAFDDNETQRRFTAAITVVSLSGVGEPEPMFEYEPIVEYIVE